MKTQECWRLRFVVPGSLLVIFGLLAAGDCFAQNALDLLARMHRVAAGTSLNGPDSKPLHLKLTIQLYDARGAVAEKGTVEDWMAGPSIERRVYSMPSFTATQLRVPEGSYRTPGTGSAPYLIDYLLTQIIHPMPNDEEIDGAKLDLRKQTFGKDDFDCVMLDQPIGNVASPPFALFPTYCLDRDKDVLRISAEFGTQLSLMSKKGLFRGIDVALDPVVSVDGKEVASATVVQLQGREQPYPETQSTDGLEVVPVSRPAKIAGGVVAGKIINKIAPIYPAKAKQKRATGQVLLHAIIGTDGHIHYLRPLTIPDPDLTIAAIAAVRQWTYQPYLLNGVPTEVDTTITVNFNMGP